MSLSRTIPLVTSALLLGSIGRSETPILTLTGTATGDHLGSCVASAGDITGDGIPELLVGSELRSPGPSHHYDGVVEVYDGATGQKLWTTNGNGYDAHLGCSVSPLRDVNGDGIPDFAVGARGQYRSPNVATGMVAAVSGAFVRNQSGPQFLWQTYGESNHDEFGFSIATIGDVDGDGELDLAVGAPLVDLPGSPIKSNVGKLYVLSGATGAVLYGYAPAGQDTEDRLGHSVSRVDDLSGDGRPDLIVGIPNDDTNNADAGAVLVLILGTNSASLRGTVYGTGAGEQFGLVVSGGSDLDGDGMGDFAVSAPKSDFPLVDAGRVQVYSGATPHFLFGVSGGQTNAGFGEAMSFAGDINGDGLPDLAVGSPRFTGSNALQGMVSLYSGSTGLLMDRLLGEGPAYHNFGQGVAIVSSLDGDRFADLLVSAPQWDGNGTSDAGRVYVFSGADLGAYVFCTGAPNSAGPGAHIGSTGSLKISANTFTVVTTGCPANKLGLYFYGRNPVNQQTFGNGWRCIGSPISRMHALTTNGQGIAQHHVDFGALPPSGQIVSGVPWNFQFWYRDPAAGGALFNASDALSATFRP